ncbi:hypothetical protein Y032_0057g2743 [Ancylostoma ceylanicum]|uniref:Uncharacterized protein n=1 Tax=Ancylostoma ceylanicum TaxID=53326 RepID=A0A016U670_9BILA|nr:hypothetical protein Y032_0057g2743 [Ancylostoma ceylanicum]
MILQPNHFPQMESTSSARELWKTLTGVIKVTRSGEANPDLVCSIHTATGLNLKGDMPTKRAGGEAGSRGECATRSGIT